MQCLNLQGTGDPTCPVGLDERRATQNQHSPQQAKHPIHEHLLLSDFSPHLPRRENGPQQPQSQHLQHRHYFINEVVPNSHWKGQSESLLKWLEEYLTSPTTPSEKPSYWDSVVQGLGLLYTHLGQRSSGIGSTVHTLGTA